MMNRLFIADWFLRLFVEVEFLVISTQIIQFSPLPTQTSFSLFFGLQQILCYHTHNKRLVTACTWSQHYYVYMI